MINLLFCIVPLSKIFKQVQNSKKNFGFTLVEVLVTITVIGVVAIITITNLYNNVLNKSIAARLGKFYNDMNQAFYFLEYEQGIDLQTTGGNCIGVLELLQPYMKLKKVGGNYNNGRNCEFELPAGDYVNVDVAGGITFNWYLKRSYLKGKRRKGNLSFIKNKGSKKMTTYCWGDCSTKRQNTREKRIQKCKETQNWQYCLYLLETDKFNFKSDNPWKLNKYGGI